MSTIFVATPLLTVLMEHHPDFKRRVATDSVEGLEAVEGITAEQAELLGVETQEPAAEPVVDEPAVPELAPAATGGDGVAAAAPAAPSKSQSKRERRRQRRSSRPHGRAR